MRIFTARQKALSAICTIAAFLVYPNIGYTAPYTEIAVTEAGVIKGKVTFEGDLPEDAIEKIAITKNPDVCGEGYREVVWIDVKDKALRGTFVFLDKVAQGKKWAMPESGNFMILQKGCRFHPWAQVIKPGPIIIRHSDGEGVLHNINTREIIGVEKGKNMKRTLFNFGQPEPGDILKNLKPRRSHYIAINCEAHNFMFGFMMAPKHPYAVVVADDGSYTIDNVPPGDYTLKSWHPRLGVQKIKITVPPKGIVESNFIFAAK